ncbi:MAG: long-chain fatty acid--CoA ligase [Actinomycetota bacterium]
MSDARPWLASYPPDVPRSLAPFPTESVFTLLEASARRAPDRPAIAWFGTSLSYAELLLEVERCSAMLAGLGVAKGDRVALIMPNSPAFTIAFYACMRVGAIAVCNNPLYTEREMTHQLGDAEPRVVIVADLMYADFAPVFATLGIDHVVVTRLNDYMPGLKKLLAPILKFKKQQVAAGKPWPPVPKGVAVLRWHEALRGAGIVPPVATVDPAHDVAALIYTGGTTGIAKGAMLSHRNLCANARQGAAWFPTVVDGHEALLAAMPFFHSYGLLAMNLTILIAAKLIPVPNPRDIHMILELTQAEKPSLFPGVPRLYIAVNEHPDALKFDLKSIMACVSGAAPLPVAVSQEFERVTGGGQLVEGYGLTECSPVTHANPFSGVRKPGSIGLPVPDTDARIMSLEDPDKEMAPGEPGELCIQGPQVMLGYWRRPEETALAIRNGWFHTGDVAVLDADGYFKIVDRLKDMILVSGFNVYPNEVEDVLYHHPAISKCAVIGLPDDRTGERVKAFVVLKEGATLTAEELRAWCKDPAQGLTGYRAPKEFAFRDSLPESLVGKVLRRVLQDEERQRAAASTA